MYKSSYLRTIKARQDARPEPEIGRFLAPEGRESDTVAEGRLALEKLKAEQYRSKAFFGSVVTTAAMSTCEAPSYRKFPI